MESLKNRLYGIACDVEEAIYYLEDIEDKWRHNAEIDYTLIKCAREDLERAYKDANELEVNINK